MTADTIVPARPAPWEWLRDNLAWLLMAATLALFATETLFNGPFWIMSVTGLYLACRSRGAVFAQPQVRHLAVLFLCLWLPQLAALPDAANPVHSLENTFAYPHYFFAGVYVLTALRDPSTLRRLEVAVFWIVTAWVLDAMLQYASGASLFGYPYRPGQLTGMFDPKIRLGHVLAVLLPVYFEIVRRHARGRAWLWLLPLLLCAVIFLSGKRVAWVMAAVAVAGYALHLLHVRLLSLRVVLLLAVIAGIAGAGLLATNPSLARRATATLGLFSGEAKQMDQATSHRLPLWETALNIASDHWINGVGTRGYRYVYRDYAGEDNFFLRDGREGQTHPHQLVLEVAAETGAIGIAGLLAFWWILLARSWRSLHQYPVHAPWLLSGVVAWLPLNAHLAFYGSYWSSVSWWVLLPLLAAPLAEIRTQPCPAS
jgi:O-antigen ligase